MKEMHRSPSNVLFVSRNNAARSLLAEACLRHLGKNKFHAFSCGVPAKVAEAPSGWTLLALQTAGIATEGLTCKGWTEFTRSGAPRFDFVIALDAETLAEHPRWNGQPETALWNYPLIAPSKRNETNLGVASIQMLVSLRLRIELLVSLHSRAQIRSDLRHDLRDLAHL
jgi:protein-tyrosine-phosphatase